MNMSILACKHGLHGPYEVSDGVVLQIVAPKRIPNSTRNAPVGIVVSKQSWKKTIAYFADVGRRDGMGWSQLTDFEIKTLIPLLNCDLIPHCLIPPIPTSWNLRHFYICLIVNILMY